MPKRLLFITSSRIGDAVLSSGVLAALVERDSRLRTTVVCGPLVSELFHDVPRLDSVIPLVKRKYAGHWVQLWRDQARKGWDTIVDLRSTGVSYFLRARHRYVLKKSDEHRVEVASNLVGLDAPAAPKIYLRSEKRARALDDIGEGPFLAVAPTANWLGKQWPLERFIEVLQDLTSAGGLFADHKILVLGAPNERDQVGALLRAFPADRVCDQVGRSSLLPAYAYLTACDFFLGNDSGLMHLAAAAGIPTLGLFGPTDERKYAPWGPQTAIVRGPRSYQDILDTPGYDWRKSVSYMLDLSVEDVLKAVHALNVRAGGAPSAGASPAEPGQNGERGDL